jgi:hypothetical protein
MVKFNIKRPVAGSSGSTTPVYGYDLYDFEDHFFQSCSGFSTLEEAKWAALAELCSKVVDEQLMEAAYS